MIDRGYCETMAAYNRWMNRGLYDLCAGLPDTERKRDRGAFFGSIHRTLDHLLDGDLAWLGRFENEPAELPSLGTVVREDFAELRRSREALDERLLRWARGVEADWLAATFSYTSQVDGRTRVLPTWQLVVHLFNHQTHHRGQLTTLLSQRGLDPGSTDLPFMPDLPG